MKNNKILIAATTLLMLSSCGVYRNFSTPVVAEKNLAGDNVELTQEAKPLISWKEFFTDTYLQELIERGLANNSDLQLALKNVEQAEVALTASKLSYFPSVGLSAKGTIVEVVNTTKKTYAVPLAAQWEIDLAGKLHNKKEQSLASLLQSKEYSKLAQTNLISAIANSYYTLVMLDGQLAISLRNLENMKKNLKTIKAMKEVGRQSEAAVNQASAALYGVQGGVKELEGQIKMVENAISLLINDTPQTIQRSSKCNSLDMSLLDNTISLEALANRPDVKVAEYALRRSFYGVNVARSAFYPSISLTGSATWTNDLGVIVNPAEMLYSAVASLAQPLFYKGMNRANLKIAKSQYEQSLISFEKSLLVAGNEVSNSLIKYNDSIEKSEYRAKQVKESRKGLKNIETMMECSSVTYLEVLTAERTLLSAELLQLGDWFECESSKISLYRALGGGVE